MTRVIINEQHTLLTDQVRALDAAVPGWTTKKVPAEGWTADEIHAVAAGLIDTGEPVIFCSPVPLLIGLMAKASAQRQRWQEPPAKIGRVGILHNDRRVAKELPGGKIIHTVAPDGWTIEWV